MLEEAINHNEPQNYNTNSKTTKINLKSLRNNAKENVKTLPQRDSLLNKSNETDGEQKNKGEKRPINTTNSDVIENKGKIRAIVNLEMMKEELKQLEDPPLTPLEKKISSARLEYSFFDRPCEDLAQYLLGKVLVRRLENGTILKGRIVETEGYLGVIDKASHTYQNKITPRNIPMYMPPGTIYIYMTYGMYHCFNISSQGDGCAVLIRGIDPLEGIECMIENRNSKTKSKSKTNKNYKTHELCNGPSKLCMAFQLEKNHSKYSMCNWKGLWLENDPTKEEIKIVKSTRIGIDSCGPEWANKPLRFYVCGNKSVSKRDKKAESLFE